MGFIGIRAIKKKQLTNHKNSCPPHVKKKEKSKARQYLQFIYEKYSHCCQCSKRAQWLRWSTGPRPGLPSSCGAAAGHPGPSPALTPASPEEQKTSQWWLTANTGLNSLTVVFSWRLPATWQSCGGSAVTLWLQGSWPTRWSGRPAADTPSPESTARGTYYQSINQSYFIHPLGT